MFNVAIQPQTTPALIVDNDTVTSTYRTAATSKGERDGRVSAQWASRPDDQKFLSLNELYDSVSLRSSRSQTQVIDPTKIQVSVDGDDLAFDINGENYTPTNYAFGQLCNLTGVPAGYVRKLPAQLAAINVQHGLIARKNDDLAAFTYKNGSNVLRATNSTSYGRIYDHDVVSQVMKIAGNGTGDTNWKVPGVINWGTSNGVTVEYNPFVDVTKDTTTLYSSDRDVYIFLVDDTHPIEIGKLPNGEPDLLFRGFIVWNSETGDKTFGMTTMLLRGVCCNRNLWGVEGSKEIRIRHTRLAPDRFAHEVAPMLLNYSNAPTAGIVSKVQNAKRAIVASTDEERVEYLTNIGLNKSVTERVLEAVLNEEQKKAESIWDMVQGITAVARKIQHQDSRLGLEGKAGKLMDKISA